MIERAEELADILQDRASEHENGTASFIAFPPKVRDDHIQEMTQTTGLTAIGADVIPLTDLPVDTLGFPICEPTRLRGPVAREISTEALRELQLPEINFEDRSGTVLVSICTINHIHLARTLIASIQEHHSPNEIAIYLLVVDWDDEEPLHIPNVTLLAGNNIGIDQFDYMALKYTALEFCCACKPYLIRYLMAKTRCRKILYVDSDIYVFARLDHLVDCLDDAQLAVIPHTFSPTPNPERFFQRPSMGDLIAAGTFNAGMFGLTVTPANVQFIDQWIYLVTAPGAFLNDLNLQHEQNFFNWLVGVADGVKVIKDRSYNVAYWNLHDRSLRYTGWDDPDKKPGWQVDGQPLVAFHFSGFSLEQPKRLSHHDTRYTIYHLPSVTVLIEFYLDRLFEHDPLTEMKKRYRYDRFSSGLKISPEIREIFKRYEGLLWRDLSPWSEPGEHYYLQSLFLPLPQTQSLLPLALHQLYQRRPDLQAAFPRAVLEPQSMIDWFGLEAMREEPTLYEYFNHHRPVVPKIEGVNKLLTIRKDHPSYFARLDWPMSKDRTRLIKELKDAGEKRAADEIRFVGCEYFVLSPVYLLWNFTEEQPHLKAAFPDLLFTDASGFAQWLREHGPSHFLDSELADLFLGKAAGRSLARIFSFLNRTPDLIRQWPLALIGQNKDACARTLLALLENDLEFDLDDVVMYLWIMSVKPWAGLPLTFELLVNARREPSAVLPEGQESLLGPLLNETGFREALRDYRSQTNDQKIDLLVVRSFEQRLSVMAGWPYTGRHQRLQGGVNFFGFFKSPVGLGSLTRGLAQALGSAGVKVQKNVITNIAMDPDLQPGDFIRTFDYSLKTNLFLSYPHIIDRLLRSYPDHVVQERKNIVYLAWEQRDGYPTWDKDYAEWDQVWALSDFAASSFRRYMKRDDIVTVPGVLDFAAFPDPATKLEVGVDPHRFVFLYVFDANSSIVRKNPEAAIAAFAQAFSASDKVQLLIKVSNANRLEHRQKLRRLVDLAARSGLDIRFLPIDLPYNQLLKLLSAVDCYVSLHRSEGFGYTCAEAMAYAKPVIATNYSATTEFMDSESAFLVDCHEVEVTVADGPFQGGSVWAEPSVEHAAALMREVYLDRQRSQWIGLNGKAKVRNLLSAERVGRIAAAALTSETQPRCNVADDRPVVLSPSLYGV